MKTEEYKLLDGRTIRAKYDRLGMCKISQENIESFVQEFNASYRQAKILEKIKENYSLMKLDERKKGKWIKEYDNSVLDGLYHCSVCGRQLWIHSKESVSDYPYCHCGAEMKHDEDNEDSIREE